jgi:hypothetical protein
MQSLDFKIIDIWTLSSQQRKSQNLVDTTISHQCTVIAAGTQCKGYMPSLQYRHLS